MNIFMKIKQHGIIGSVKKTVRKMCKIIRPNRLKNYNYLNSYFYGKTGIEIGGPSGIFSNNGLFPVYKIIKNLDGVNFSDDTIWTGNMGVEGYVINGKKYGDLFIADATDLTILENDVYDFVLSCNNIEHIANPMKAVHQWLLKLKDNGVIMVIAPRKESNFDHNREIVKFEHILDDFNEDIAETDLTHLDEILKLHDLEMDPPAGNYEQFKTRSLNNYKNRCLHHHVFNLEVLRKIFEYFELKIVYEENIYSDYIIIGKK